MESYRFDHFSRRRFVSDLAFRGGPAAGRPLPDFDLPTVTGGRVRKSDFAGGRPLLLAFASLTDPIAASAAPVLRRLHRRFCEAVAFVTVYVREAHPGERIPQPRNLDEKLRHARALRARDGLGWIVAVDDLDGTFHRALGGNSSAAYLVDADGAVAFRTLCSNDEGSLRRALEALECRRAPRAEERRRRIVPLALGLARVDEVVRAAGPGALREFRREMPLLFAAAEVAWVWRALTPIARAVATGIALAGAVGLCAGIRRARQPRR